MQTRSLLLTTMLSISAASGGALASGTHVGVHDDEAIGVPGEAAKVSRTIAVNITDDMRFTPAHITVIRGETIRFKVTNAGKIKHEFVLGTAQDLEQHNDAMKKFPGMEHDEENMVALAPATTGEVVWRFTKSGEVDFACLQPGHYDAGMKGQVIVTATKKQGDR